MRTGSAAGFHGGPGGPSRTHSPLTGPGAPPHPPPQFVLPHPVGQSFYAHQPPAPPPPAPSILDFERHHHQLLEGKRWLEDMLERTNAMLAGMERGINEMKAGSGPGEPLQRQPTPQQNQHQSSPQHHQQPQQQQGQSMPAPTSSPVQGQNQAQPIPLGRSDRPGAKDSVWPVAPPAEPQGRD
ncbi:hypothetical protein K474DRAFT_1597740 [Panus rudis PR-1116 ss-1]|nr:hypothetical protein K474DRAFT_1597740 [Panus rudis PR-1116 ss-1]